MIEAALAAEVAAEVAGGGAAAAGGAEMGAFGGAEVVGPEGQIAGEVDHSAQGAFENARQFEQQLGEGDLPVHEVEVDWSSDAAERNAGILRQMLEGDGSIAIEDGPTMGLDLPEAPFESREAAVHRPEVEIDESKLLRAEGDSRPPNWEYAGDTLPPERLTEEARALAPDGVPIKENGCPDFTEWSEANVEIEMTGDRAEDYKRANEAAGYHDAGYRSPKEGYVWHHNEDGKTMQLVPFDLHDSVKHRGGVYVVNRLAEGKEVHGR